MTALKMLSLPRFNNRLIAVAATFFAVAALAVSLLVVGANDTLAQQSAPGNVSNITVTRADGTVTASWDAVSGASKYHAMYSDDDRGSWHGPVDDHTNIQTTSITFSADNAKSIIVGVRAGNDNGWSEWTDSPTVGPYTPGAVSSVTVTRADGTVTASWDAVPGATKYHSMYSDDDRGSWHGPVDDHTNIQTTSITFDADNAKSIIVGVRAWNDNGWSEWTDSPTVGPYTPPPPGAVPSVSVARADGTVTASWQAVPGATKYHAMYSDDDRGSWHGPVDDHTNIQTTSITFDADNAKNIIVGVRAGNDQGWSEWTDSPTVGPYTPPTPRGIIVQDTSGNPLSAISVPEGDEASYQVLLTAPPTEDVEVCVALFVRDNDDSDITFKDEAADVVSIKLTFTSENWNTAQTVTLVAAEDDTDDVNGARDVTHDAREYYSGKVDITATEIDNDEITLPDAPADLTATSGDGSVTLAWSDPSDASITGYEYNVNHNDTSSGNLSGWGPWTSIAGSDSATTSHTFTGLTNGREYRYHLRAVNSAGNGTAAPNEAPWFASATPLAFDPNLTVDNLFVDPGNGYLDISWNAAEGATHYDIRAREANVNNWHAVAWKWSGTSYRYTTDKTIDYVAVRALSADSIGPWVELSRMPADDFMNVASGISVASASGASIQSGASVQSKLAAPTGLTITRFATRRTEIDLNWTDSTSAGVTAYNVICAVGQSGWAWHACGWEDSGTVTYTSVPSAQTRPVTVTHYERKAGESPHIPGKYKMGYTRAYRVSVRAVNANPDDASPWVESGVIYPIFGYLKDFTYTRSAGQITMTWTPSYFTTGYEFYCDAYDPTQTPYVPSYTRCATLTDQDDTDDKHSVTISSWTAGGTDYSIDDTKEYDIRICSTNATGRGCTLAPWIKPTTLLSVSGVKATGATLTIINHRDAWYYKATSGPHTTCQGPVAAGTSNQSLSGLTVGNSYTYSAYSDSTCTDANKLATAAEFTTTASLTVSSITDTGATLTISGHTGQWWYQGQEVGGSLGTCTSVPSGSTATLTGLDSNKQYDYKAYDKANCAAADLLTTTRFVTIHPGGGPGFTATDITHNSARLTLSNHTGNWWYQGGSRSGGDGACTAGPSNFVVDLASLSASTAYTYSAYSDNRCRTLITSATTVTFDTLDAPD